MKNCKPGQELVGVRLAEGIPRTPPSFGGATQNPTPSRHGKYFSITQSKNTVFKFSAMNLLVLAPIQTQASDTLIELQSLKTTIQTLDVYQEIWRQCYKEIWTIQLKTRIVYAG
jgi:hypothetical protein